MRLKACAQIQKINGKIYVLIDESTTLTNLSTVIGCLKCETSKSDNPHFLFLDLVELEDQSAATIGSRVVQCLNKYKFDYKYLMTNFVAFACDGASAMLGKKSGVATIIVEKYRNVIVWHCLNHCLELAVGDAIREVTAVNHFQMFFDKLYSLYSRSPKNKIQLSEFCSVLQVSMSS